MHVPTSSHLGHNPDSQRHSSPDVLPQSRPQSRQGQPPMAAQHAQHGSQHAHQGQAGVHGVPGGLTMINNHGAGYLPGQLRLGFMPGPPGQAHSQPGMATSGPMPMQMAYGPNGGLPMPASQHMLVHPSDAGPRVMSYSQADMPRQDIPHDCHMHGASPEPPACGPRFRQGPMQPLPSLSFQSAPMQAAHGMGGAGMADGMHQVNAGHVMCVPMSRHVWKLCKFEQLQPLMLTWLVGAWPLAMRPEERSSGSPCMRVM